MWCGVGVRWKKLHVADPSTMNKESFPFSAVRSIQRRSSLEVEGDFETQVGDIQWMIGTFLFFIIFCFDVLSTAYRYLLTCIPNVRMNLTDRWIFSCLQRFSKFLLYFYKWLPLGFWNEKVEKHIWGKCNWSKHPVSPMLTQGSL